MAVRSDPGQDPASRGRLTARPVRPPPVTAQKAGLRRLAFDGREAEVFVPESYRAGAPMPLMVLLHGATQDPAPLVSKARGLAGRAGFIILAPKSRGVTWDLIEHSAFGADTAFLDAALKRLFAEFAIDPDRIAIGGFSDGASYALSLGLLNGDLFSDVMAFSAGFAAVPQPQGRPRVFISHGRKDPILPIERCGRVLARDLAHADYDVVYREFDGGHVLPPEIFEAAVGRFLGRA